MSFPLEPTEEQRNELVEQVAREIQLRGLTSSAVLFLASKAGGYVTGKVIEVDGGIESPTLDMGLPDL